LATKKKATAVVEAPDILPDEPIDRKGWKYYCNDELVTEEVFNSITKDHQAWIDEQEKIKEAAALATQKEDAKLAKKKVKKTK